MAGQAARRGVVCVERFARNLDDAAAPDNLGVARTAAAISAGAPERLEAAAPVEAIADAIREAGIPARVSRSAGGFVCNHLYFGALQYLRDKRSATPAVFVHLPATPRQTAPSGEREAAHSGRGGEGAQNRGDGDDRRSSEGGMTGAPL